MTVGVLKMKTPDLRDPTGEALVEVTSPGYELHYYPQGDDQWMGRTAVRVNGTVCVVGPDTLEGVRAGLRARLCKALDTDELDPILYLREVVYKVGRPS